MPHPLETALLEAVLAAPAATGPLWAYHDWLAERSDPRADCVAGLIAALGGDGEQLVTRVGPWSDALGLPLADALASEGLVHLLPKLLPQTRMGMELVFDGSPAGRTRLFGDPDLPPSMPWPTHGDCTMYSPLPEVDPALPCRFVAQLDLRELSAPGLPHLSGLLSVFVFQEYDEYGSAGVVTHHFPDGAVLETRPHPDCDEANERLPSGGIQGRPVRMAPGEDGPWADLDDAHPQAMEITRDVLWRSAYGAFGHLRGTSGADPTPSREHHRLVVLPGDVQGVLNVHLAIHEAALAAGDLSTFELVWVDFDGL